MASEFRLVRQVEFFETDMAGIMHFSNFFRFMEAAEHAFFRSLGFSIHTTEPEPVGWPRVHVECDYKAPLRFEDTVEIRLLVRERRERSVRYVFIFSRLNGGAPAEVARGEIVAVCVRQDPETGAFASTSIPEAIARCLEPAPAEWFA